MEPEVTWVRAAVETARRVAPGSWTAGLDAESPWPLALAAAAALAALQGATGAASATLPGVGPYYRALPLSRRLLWDNRVVSVVHAAVVSAGAARVLWLDPALAAPSFARAYAPAGHAYMAFFAGYSLFDLAVMLRMLRFHDGTASVSMVIHHLVALCSVAIPLAARKYTYPSLCFLLNEISTPFLHLRYLMDDLRIGRLHGAYVANQAAFLAVFFAVRVVFNLWVGVQVYRHFALADDALARSDDWAERRDGVLGPLLATLLIGLNVYWFALILARAASTLRQLRGGAPRRPKAD